jgi:lycopene cyclase CruP
VIQTQTGQTEEPDWDIVICGATLGVLLGAALAQQGWRVALLERGQLRGRDQEWNISRQELEVLISLELLTETELEQAIATAYNPGRIQFLGGPELWVRDVLNIGVDPVYLLERLKQKFLAAGGHLLEQTNFEQAVVRENGVTVQLKPLQTSDPSRSEASPPHSLTTRLLIDAMGHFSPRA